jgi:hypothetical protein
MGFIISATDLLLGTHSISDFGIQIADRAGITKGEDSGALTKQEAAEKVSFPGCSKRARCKAPEILRSEAYLAVRCNDEG